MRTTPAVDDAEPLRKRIGEQKRNDPSVITQALWRSHANERIIPRYSTSPPDALRRIKPFPTDEAFDGLVLGQPQSVVDLCRLGVASFGALPEFSGIGTWEQGAVFL